MGKLFGVASGMSVWKKKKKTRTHTEAKEG
jgi:hypothetical protein